MTNKRSLRILSLMLALLMTTGSISCGNTTEETKQIPGTAAEQTTADETEPETIIEETEPEIVGPDKVDLGGYSFRMLSSTWLDEYKYLYRDELTGEPVNDALYNANLALMNDYNCTLSPIVLNSADAVKDAIAASVKASLDEYDMQLNYDNKTAENAINGYHLNIRDSEIFNFDAPWWTKTADAFTIGDGLYFTANYATYSPVYFGFVLCYNKTLAENLHIEIPYDKIFAGDWYLDDLIALIADTQNDLDGNGNITVDSDQIGLLMSHGGALNFQVSMGISMLSKDEEGYLVFNPNLERLYTLMTKYEKLMENGMLVNGNKDATINFAKGNTLFALPQVLDIPAQMGTSEVQFGTIPMPKLDELQEDYISGAFDIYWAIPKTAYKNLDTIATVMEAMGYNCVKDVLPKAYETALKVRFSDSPEDAQVYEIIRDTLCVDIGYALAAKVGSLRPMLYALVEMNSGNIASNFQQNSKVLSKSIDQVNKVFREMNQVSNGEG